MVGLAQDAEKMGLPVRVFLFTLDQVADMVNVKLEAFRRDYVYFDGHSTGVPPRERMMARNIAPAADKTEWRIAEKEVIRWLRYQGFKIYERGYSVK